MGDAVGAVTGAVGDVVGGVVGGTQKGIAKQMGPGFKGQTREIDANAFNISAAQNVENKTRQLAGRAGKRATQAQRQQQGSRKGQRGLISQLQAQSAGRGPSLAEAQLRSAQDRSLKQQLAAAAAQRGGNQAALQRALARSQAEQAATTGQQAAEARIQEQLAARQQLAGALQAQRSQDLQALGLQQQSQSQFLAQQLGASRAQQEAQAALQELETRQFLNAQGLTADAAMQQQKSATDITGGLLSGAATMFGSKSDKNMKKSVKSYSDKNMKKNSKTPKKSDEFNPKSFLSALTANSYEYKDNAKNTEGAGEGRFLGVMAQDLEKAGPVGKSMVKETEAGKMVDYGKGFGAILAAQAHLNKRLEELESKKKKRK